mgnify:CR=1 FL=1
MNELLGHVHVWVNIFESHISHSLQGRHEIVYLFAKCYLFGFEDF